jgi:hypothetical protein
LDVVSGLDGFAEAVGLRDFAVFFSVTVVRGLDVLMGAAAFRAFVLCFDFAAARGLEPFVGLIATCRETMRPVTATPVVGFGAVFGFDLLPVL